MSTTMQLFPLAPSPSPSSAPPTPPYPSFPRLPSSASSPSITRNASTCSSASTSSTSSSLVAAPIRPPPIETRTAATTPAQLPSRPGSADQTAQNYASQSPLRHQIPIGHRAPIRNGPRSRSTVPRPPAAISSSSPSPQDVQGTPERRQTAPGEDVSPTTPRAPKWVAPGSVEGGRKTPRVTVSTDQTYIRMDDDTIMMSPKPVRGRATGQWSTPSSPVDDRSPRNKQRTLSVDGRPHTAGDERRERRISQASAGSSTSTGTRKPSLRDFILGDELGRGSYSTVVQATAAASLQSSNTRPPRQYAIKIINQAHLVAEKKVKYAIIERDALIRLAQPAPLGTGHRRGISGSSSGQVQGQATRRRSNASINAPVINKRETPAFSPSPRDRLSVATDGSSSTGYSIPLSPTLASSLAVRRLSRTAESSPMVTQLSEEHVIDSPIENLKSQPPSPMREELGEYTPPGTATQKMDESPIITTAPPTPEIDSTKRSTRSRRQSLASSDRSGKSNKSHPSAHPGIIRLHSTFNDQTSLYFVLDLAKNGELLGFIRKYGSLDITSARYYAAQMVDTIGFMHERDVIHRDLKPENILLDDEMRIKITDFGSAKIVGRESDAPNDSGKRSFVGSADFVSPEVLRSEPAVFASDVWAFGCILFQLLAGRPPFRGATDYLTFQRILKRDFQWPTGIDEDAKSLIDQILNLDPKSRPTLSEIKAHSFFSPTDWNMLWRYPAPQICTGLIGPINVNANAPMDSDVWAVFDDEVSDGGFEYDDDEVDLTERDSHRRPPNAEPEFDRRAAADAVQSVDDSRQRSGSSGSLEPPRPAFVEGERRKGRKWSVGTKSARTSSSSSNNRNALSGLLETMGIHSSTGSISGGAMSESISMHGGSPMGAGKTGRSADKVPNGTVKLPSINGPERWSSLLLANEKILYSSLVSVRSLPASGSTLIPNFLLPAPKSRFLILTDFPRLIEVKETADESSGARVKFEAVFLRHPSPGSHRAEAMVGGDGAGATNRVTGIHDRGNKGFVVNTVGSSVSYMADATDTRSQWMNALRTVTPI